MVDVNSLGNMYDIPMSDMDEKANALEPTYVRFGEVVRKLRMQAGMTQGELSKSLTNFGVDMRQNTITKLEQGSRPTNLKECIALAEALGVKPIELFQQAFPSTAANSTEYQNLLAREAQLDRELNEVEAQIDRHKSKIQLLNAAHGDLTAQIWEVRARIVEIPNEIINGDD